MKPRDIIPFRSISEFKKETEEMKTGSQIYTPSDRFTKIAKVREEIQHEEPLDVTPENAIAEDAESQELVEEEEQHEEESRP